MNVLKIWSLKEKTFGVRLELWISTPPSKCLWKILCNSIVFFSDFGSVRTMINESAARDLFRKMDYKKRGYVTYQQMSEFWEDI